VMWCSQDFRKSMNLLRRGLFDGFTHVSSSSFIFERKAFEAFNILMNAVSFYSISFFFNFAFAGKCKLLARYVVRHSIHLYDDDIRRAVSFVPFHWSVEYACGFDVVWTELDLHRDQSPGKRNPRSLLRCTVSHMIRESRLSPGNFTIGKTRLHRRPISFHCIRFFAVSSNTLSFAKTTQAKTHQKPQLVSRKERRFLASNISTTKSSPH
jgi:hypothetical protein